MFESEFHVSRALKRAARWFKTYRNISIHKAPRHIKEKFSLLKLFNKNA